jgi:hypothetical protein
VVLILHSFRNNFGAQQKQILFLENMKGAKSSRFNLLISGILLLLCVSFFSFKILKPFGEKPNCMTLLRAMTDSIDKIKDMRFHLKSLERIGDKYLSADSDIKLAVNPRKMYFINPSKKLEILYRSGEHGENALVKPHVFPYTSLYLDPNGSLMRKNQHYTVNELGFNFISKTIKSILVKDKEKTLKNMIYLGIVNKSGQPCHMIMYDNKEFVYFDYKVGKNESVSSIALKNYLSDFMIRSKNELHSYYGDVKEGKVLKLPSNYCRKATIFISEKTLLPVALNIYDENDLWESYEYSNVKVNTGITPEEFTRGFKDYHF